MRKATCFAPFNVPMYYDSPAEFELKHERKFLREANSDGNWNLQPRDIQKLLRLHFESRYPFLHKYNNALGYVEFEIDESDILIYYFLNGDRRKKYNRIIKYRNTRTAIFPNSSHTWGGSFHRRTNEQIRKAFLLCFVQLKDQCKEWNVYIDTEAAENIVRYFDFESWLNSQIRNEPYKQL